MPSGAPRLHSIVVDVLLGFSFFFLLYSSKLVYALLHCTETRVYVLTPQTTLVVGVVQGGSHVQHVQGEYGQLHGVAQEGHVTHHIDQAEFRNVLMQLQEVGVVQGEAHVLADYD
jgi:hypothetical protein